MIISPSILASDFTRLGDEVNEVLSAGADWIHIDVMDGRFVPPISLGTPIVEALRKSTGAILDVHLMIENPGDQIDAFADAGADIITIHAEATPHAYRLLQQIRALGKQAGIAINPGTPVSMLEPIIEIADLVLVMTVNPGWGGQKFIPSSCEKISAVRKILDEKNLSAYLEVDGGIDAKTAKLAYQAGAKVFVAGTSIFRESNYVEAISKLREASKQ